MSKFEFEGIPSGDYESFCWDVDKETYVEIKTNGYKAKGILEEEIKKEIACDMKWDKAKFHDDMYMIYPNDVIDRTKERQKIIISCERINHE